MPSLTGAIAAQVRSGLRSATATARCHARAGGDRVPVPAGMIAVRASSLSTRPGHRRPGGSSMPSDDAARTFTAEAARA